MWWFIGNIWWLANLFELNLVFGWKSFCKLRNELLVIDFSNVTWKLILMAFVLICTLCFKFLNFQSMYGVFMSFLDFTRIIFEFLFLLTHMSLWMVFMLVLRFLEFYMSNDRNSKLKLWNLKNSGLSEIWWCGQSAGKRRTVRRSWNLFTRGSAEKFSTAKIHCGRSARLSRTVREWTERRIQAAKFIMSYKGISLVDHIHLGAYEMLELDIYMLVLLAIRCLNGLNG